MGSSYMGGSDDICPSYAGLYVTPMMAIVSIIASVNVKNLQ